jgi:hypothetical protein
MTTHELTNQTTKSNSGVHDPAHEFHMLLVADRLAKPVEDVVS